MVVASCKADYSLVCAGYVNWKGGWRGASVAQFPITAASPAFDPARSGDGTSVQHAGSDTRCPYAKPSHANDTGRVLLCPVT